MNLFVVLTALLFYTKATETKECQSYVITEKEDEIPNLIEACKALNGKMASEDLKDSENAKAAKKVVDEYHNKGQSTELYLGITVKEPEQPPNKDTNPFVFSDGTNFDIDNKNFVYPWASGVPSYNDIYKCAYVDTDKKIWDNNCDSTGKALCFIVCPSSGSESSRKNFPLFALFVAGSVFNAFYALAGLDF